MARALFCIGAVIGIIASVILAGDYEVTGLMDSTYIALVTFTTALCVGGFVVTLLPAAKVRATATVDH